MEIKEAQEWIRIWADKKGWGFAKRDIPEKLALIHSEISEALEDYRDDNHGMAFNEFRIDPRGKPIGFGIELADAVIRILHLGARLNINIEAMVEVKMAYNEKREYRHGGKIA